MFFPPIILIVTKLASDYPIIVLYTYHVNK